MSSDDEYQGAVDNDEIDISYYNQDEDLLKLMNLLSDEEENGDDVQEDIIHFVST